MDNYYETTCVNCGKKFKRHNRLKKEYKYRSVIKAGKVWNFTGREYCSRECRNKTQSKEGTIIKPCGWCGNKIKKNLAEFKKSKSGEIFCSQSCACSYNNTKKRKSRRSKSEKLLFDLIEAEFPNLKIIANDKDLLDGYELDIVIPSIGLAIEWNGIVHYKPIYGQDKLTLIQKRDQEKQERAKKKGISLIIVPDLVSTDKYVREAFYKIKSIIKELLP